MITLCMYVYINLLRFTELGLVRNLLVVASEDSINLQWKPPCHIKNPFHRFLVQTNERRQNVPRSNCQSSICHFQILNLEANKTYHVEVGTMFAVHNIS